MFLTDEMLYAAFRAAFVHTLDCMLRETLEQQHSSKRGSGFLDVYPVLQGAAPQIQLECLLDTWDHLNRGESRMTRLNTCVVNAALESLAKMAGQESQITLASVWRGPVHLNTGADHWVISKVRALQLAMDESTSSQLEGLSEHLSDRGISPCGIHGRETKGSTDDLLAIVGRWTASKTIMLESQGLLTQDEQDILRVFFEEQPGLLR
ncbi:MAG TPA: hypothetical protein PK992_09955 [Planctomycetaceae bacterium]|nr:hypothetical protein [Planctomycetaceae bacterium]